ncbi:MAG: oligosaccharide flippase family protein, partial [Bacteroidales bacterium]|nr:oligosaccharide flippase family protein [Bacteroidales bacterium]
MKLFYYFVAVKNKWMDSEFRKNFIALFTGSTLAQVIPFLLAPILSRIFQAEDYAIYGLYISILEVLAIIIAGRYELTIVLPKENRDAIHLAAGALMIAIVLSIIVFILSFFFNDSLSIWLKNPSLADYLYLLPLSLLFYAITRILNNYLIRKKEFKTIAKYKLTHKTGEALSA